MAKSEERRRVLDMLAAGQINVEQATALLKALGPSQAEAMTAGPERRSAGAAPTPPKPPNSAGGAGHGAGSRSNRPRFLKISVASDDPEGKGDVKIVVPYALAKFALRFIPNDARTKLDEQGIDLKALLEGLDDEMIDGQLLNVEADKGDGSGRAHITIEVN